MDPAKLKVVELRAELSQRGLDSKGNKAVLVERLRKALEEENASQHPETIHSSAENMSETVLKETNEKSVESAKSPQAPKTPGRSSRSASVTTPTKIATRSAPKTSTPPNSMKQSSPSKVQHTEMSDEMSPGISESVLEEQTALRDEKSLLSEENENREPTDLSLSSQNETCSSRSIKSKQESKGLDVTVQIEECPIISQISVIKSFKKSSEFIEQSFEKLEDTNANVEHSEPFEVAASAKEEKSESAQITVESGSSSPMEVEDEEKLLADENIEEDTKTENVIDEEQNEPESGETIDLLDDVNDTTNTDIPDIKTSAIDPVEDEKEDLDVDDKTKTIQEESLENTKIEHADAKEVDMKVDDSTNDKANEQDTDMTKIEHQEETGAEAKEQPEKSSVKDRKRKRSPSPVEACQPPATPLNVEDEPEIDDSALTLSWYDSDLNLIIDKDGFLTATPLHYDAFVHMSAGARASYGFLCGKVYYETKITEFCTVNLECGGRTHVLRIGWSASYTSMQLGEEKLSYGYDSSGKKCTGNEFVDYGIQFDKNDVIGCYLDATSEDNIVLSYTVNGKDQGTAFTISKQELNDQPLFPHILSKNCSFTCNFGQEEPWSKEILPDFVSIGNVDSEYKVPGPRRPAKKEECEVLLICGLPGCGKTTWAMKYAAEHPPKSYNVLGLASIIDQMKDMGLPYKQSYTGRWETLMEKCTRALNKLLATAPTRRRNYILDQTNIYSFEQRRKMKSFSGYQRKAVVIVPSEDEFKLRAEKHKSIDGKQIADSVIMEMKANFNAPVVGEFFDAVDWIELDKEEGKKLIEKYNKEGKEAGYGQQQTNKRPRIESRPENNRENRDFRSNRDSRDSRDHRERRGNYPDRNRTSVWRGGNNMGWRDRQQRGGHVRHGGGYGPPVPWRGRGAPIPSHRGLDRRGGSGDRRSGNDRGRSTAPRQGGWAQMSSYQGSNQQSNWNQQNNWSSGQSQGGWGQQSGWGGGGQQWGNWKGYGQSSYNQTNYNQQSGYGNGNWNSWNQQYYNQYWGQQQQTGQTTAAGGQATGTTESVTTASSGDSSTGYNYTQDWRGYADEYTPSVQSTANNSQRFRQHK